MSELFLNIVNMSIAAGWLVLAVLLLRLVLKKAPKWVNVLLWGLVAVRLLCPFRFESPVSLVPSAQTISPDIMMDRTPEIESGISSVNGLVNPVIHQAFAPKGLTSANPLQIWIPIIAGIWVTGMVVMVLYTAFSYLRLRLKVREAVRLRDNIYQCEGIPSPFVLGILKPRVYLPYHISPQDAEHVIAHELAHIRRRDHWWKPLGYGLLTVHWFNPLMWVAYILLCRDIELACDEKVIKKLGTHRRADYSQALLACSVHPRQITACPLAFGEVGVRKRVKNILSYKKPAFWVVVAAVILCAAAAVCFLTDPWEKDVAGIRDLKVSTIRQQALRLDIDYAGIYGYRVRQLTAEDPEYLGDGVADYHGELGEYRVEISLGDALPSAEFLEKYPVGKVHELGEGLKMKLACPDDSTLVIYIGAALPLTVREQEFTKVSQAEGTLSIEIGVGSPGEDPPVRQITGAYWSEGQLCLATPRLRCFYNRTPWEDDQLTRGDIVATFMQATDIESIVWSVYAL